MKLPLILLSALLLCGCGDNVTYVTDIDGDRHPVTRIEGCEYIVFSRSITHKGNCTNHQYIEFKAEKPSDNVKPVPMPSLEPSTEPTNKSDYIYIRKMEPGFWHAPTNGVK